jgi:NAD(P)-dependent dehydrogenase (short-subunit alcohol dehydrogenase family)
VSGGRQLDGDPYAERRLDDRVLVVTGGTQGLGAAIAAAELADEGAYRAVIAACDEAARLMRRGGGGSIVNIITMASHGGEPALTAYAASKGALATEGEQAVQTGTGEPEDWLASADSAATGEHVAAPAGASA